MRAAPADLAQWLREEGAFLSGRISLKSTQAQLLKQVKQDVQLRLGGLSPSIKSYYASYKKEFQGRWQSCSMRYLWDEIGKVQVLLGGDFHAFGQSQRSHLRVLRALPQGKKIVLGLECIEARYQSVLDQYFLGQIGERQFLKLVKWKEHWGFPWSHYRPLLQIAVERGYPVVALNRYFTQPTEKQLKKRDEFAAAQILKIKKSNPNHLIYVVFGDLHLAQAHLPAALWELQPDLQILRLFQSSQKLYFDLAKKKQEQEVEILKSKGQRFCLMWFPPWVKWQSYLMHLESAGEEELEGEVDFTDYVSSLVSFVAEELNIKISTNNLAVSGLNRSWIYTRLKEQFSNQEFRMARFLIQADRSFYCPGLGIGYMSRSSVNHAASLAGEYIQSHLSQRKSMAWSFPHDFEGLIWTEAMSFFLSKIINHKRKAEFQKEIGLIKESLKSQFMTSDRSEAWGLAMDVKMSELIFLRLGRKRQVRFKPKQKTSYLGAARYLGQVLGDNLYGEYRNERVSLPTIKKYLSQDIFAKNFREKYLETLRTVNSGRSKQARQRKQL